MPVFARVLMLCLAMAIASAAKATAQASDWLIVEGKKFALNTNPLDTELRKKQWERPENAVISSGNWRGYIATWEIKGGELFLKDVTIAIRDPKNDRGYTRKSITQELYPGATQVRAD